MTLEQFNRQFPSIDQHGAAGGDQRGGQRELDVAGGATGEAGGRGAQVTVTLERRLAGVATTRSAFPSCHRRVRRRCTRSRPPPRAGRRRRRNEDAVAVFALGLPQEDLDIVVLAVADGLGEHARGTGTSAVAVEAFGDALGGLVGSLLIGPRWQFGDGGDRGDGGGGDQRARSARLPPTSRGAAGGHDAHGRGADGRLALRGARREQPGVPAVGRTSWSSSPRTMRGSRWRCSRRRARTCSRSTTRGGWRRRWA